VHSRMFLPDGPRLRALLRIGWPSALENLEELGISTYMSILCARLGTVLLAAHQVVLDLNAFVYQVPAGLSYATIVRVGQSAGRNSLLQVRRAANASLWLGLGFMLIAATVFAAFARFWAGLYTNSSTVVIAAVPIFLICAFLLMGDTLFVLLASALTGLGDTRTPMLVSLVWNWGIGMPLAYLLAFHYGLALRGLWIGRGVGSVGAGLSLLYFWRLRLRREAHASERPSLNLLSTLPTADQSA
jgi:multidrug resistance protein, MATE family